MRDEFLKAAVWHGSLERAEEILAGHPEIAAADIYTAAVLGDDAGIRRFLAFDPAHAASKGGPHGWDALTYLCFSRYLRLRPALTPGFVRAAGALLDAGAPANTGFYDTSHQPEPEFESALYGAAGVAHHAELTRLLLAHGADPNDEEVPYHTPESYDNAALQAIVETGKLTPDSLAIMLLRKHDWHDGDGVRWLLAHGADPNRVTRWRRTAFHQAVLRDNGLETLEAVLDFGGDPNLAVDGMSAAILAARRGRSDFLDLLKRRGLPIHLDGAERLLAACARDEAAASGFPAEIATHSLAEFAGNGNTAGVRRLLDLGVDIGARYSEPDGYWGIGNNSTALHVAAWRARHATVKLLLERGAPVNVLDAKGRTALMLAVRACVDSYWIRLRSPESAQALLQAGASVAGVQYPSGYEEVDHLLGQAGCKA